MAKKAVVLLSGGLDSATVAAIAREDGYETIGLSFHYGQRHVRELEAAKKLAPKLGIRKHFIVEVNLSLWGGSSLTDTSLPVPQEGVNPNIIPSTYVPGRNTVFIAIALSLAEAVEAEAIYLGVNAIDYSGYPDCRPEYLEAFQRLANLSSKAGIEGKAPKLVAPLIQLSKVEIVKKAISLSVPIEETWSCYQGGEKPCGVCDSCRIRNKALIEAGYPELVNTGG
ncbi:MAG: 7-cyano-7-deazaguanine synthase QueC [Geminocystis sp.]|nr:7-cyano-7-deazaguanine synthase QueC [Geminocystis sp.]HIK38081.1 7-cyano-7-deazaguanine synthase QueC [Geminocystis sp. M7585_C2015_104]MCS7149062.1 7-cyano-7-deazaguanine synthase QueC [Geminocystis sp.]MCX8077421.1 7-cyano-7-deazaguanine synthase QueC [Geminocystis sp.]MDW8117139.1 7-cyano-7-deazaguanine synthase QueC [Geminocystis sp.]